MEKEKTFQDLKTNVHDAVKRYQEVLLQSHDQALELNETQRQQWEEYSKEHMELSARLLSLRDELSQCIMVPLGRRALMPGRLVHTNELLVFLGDGWFVKKSAKQAAEICQRRIQNCNEMLNKLEKERELLTSRKTFSFDNDTFGAGTTQEIVEPYEEDEEIKWREQHRQREKEYRKKLTDLKRAQSTKIETEEDLWKRLNALDLQEELEDELNRMDEEVESEDEDQEETSDDEDSGSTDYDENKINLNEQNVGIQTKTLKRRVSFREGDENCQNINETKNDCDENNHDLICITFKHSDSPSCVLQSTTDEIVCPSDIYTQYARHRMPKSILKPFQSMDNLLSEIPVGSPPVIETEVQQCFVEPSLKAVEEEVVERTLAPTAAPSTERPVSQFKAARMASKR